MTTNTVPLDNLAQRIAEQQAELDALQREFQARQAHLAELRNRKKELKAQLSQLDVEIRAVNKGDAPALGFSPEASPREPLARAASQKRGRKQTLPVFIVEVMRGAHGPLTVKELAQEVKRRKYKTRSKNIPRLVQARVQELVADGVLRRAADKSGLFLGDSVGEPTAPVSRARTKKKGRRKKKVVARSLANGSARTQQKPLRLILTDLLMRSKRPLPARELAEQAKAQGYQTKSKNLINVVWVVLGKMNNIENVAGQGYRLLKR